MEIRLILIEKFILIIKGFFIGFADLIPGVSGGTIAFISGIYYKLIEAVKSFNSDWLKSVIRFDIKGIFSKPHLEILIPVITGQLCAVFFFTKIISIPLILDKYPEYLYGIFFGLVSCSSALIIIKLKKTILLKDLLFLLIGIILGLYIITGAQRNTSEEYWFIYICGVISVSAMLTPGISGSLLLLMLNKYTFMLEALRTVNISVLFFFIAGLGTGLIFFSRAISFMLSKYYNKTMMLTTGTMISSLWIIWPFQNKEYIIFESKKILTSSFPYLPETVSSETLGVYGLIFAGVSLIAFLEFLQYKLSSENSFS